VGEILIVDKDIELFKRCSAHCPKGYNLIHARSVEAAKFHLNDSQLKIEAVATKMTLPRSSKVRRSIPNAGIAIGKLVKEANKRRAQHVRVVLVARALPVKTIKSAINLCAFYTFVQAAPFRGRDYTQEGELEKAIMTAAVKSAEYTQGYPASAPSVKNILIAEDDSAHFAKYKEPLEKKGFTVDGAWHRQSAFDYLAGNKKYLAVITDLRMPINEWNPGKTDDVGLDILAAVRKKNKYLPVILVTKEDVGVQELCTAMQAQVSSFVSKTIEGAARRGKTLPADVRRLLALIKQLTEI